MSDEELMKDASAEQAAETAAPGETEPLENDAAEDTAVDDPTAEGGASQQPSEGEPEARDPESEEQPPEEKPDETEILKGRLLRLQADFDNYRKRVARDHAELVSQAGADVLKAMLDPMDHLEMAIESMARDAKDDDPVLTGVRMVRDEFLRVFDRFSLKPIDTKIGAELDPNAEEALGILPVPGIPENRIAVVVRKGYTLHGKVLRAAQVMVGAGTPAETAPHDAPAAADGAGKED